MAEKYQRIYNLLVESRELGTALKLTNNLKEGLTIEFDVDRGIYGGFGTLNLNIYNLSRSSRSYVFQDTWDRDVNSVRTVALEAGYQFLGLSTIFIGHIQQAYSYRKQSDIITNIQAIDGGLLSSTAEIHETLQKGTMRSEVVRRLVSKIGLKEGKIDIEDVPFEVGFQLDGNAFKLLKTYAGRDREVWITDGEVNVMKTSQALKGTVRKISAENGLLNVPQHKGGSLVLDMVFEPRLTIGQVVEVESTIAPEFNGQYKIIGLKHKGIISSTQAGQATTTVELLSGSRTYSVVSTGSLI